MKLWQMIYGYLLIASQFYNVRHRSGEINQENEWGYSV